MSLNEAHARVKSRVWQAIAQTELDVSALDKATLESLVDLVTDAALLEIDETMAQSLPQRKTADAADDDDDNKEEILWEGRPFLSLSLYYVITDERVRISEGILGKTRENIELVRVQDIDYSQTFSERLLNVGDITIRSHDSSHPKMELKNVKDPEQVHEILRRAVLNARKKYGFRYREEM